MQTLSNPLIPNQALKTRNKRKMTTMKKEYQSNINNNNNSSKNDTVCLPKLDIGHQVKGKKGSDDDED